MDESLKRHQLELQVQELQKSLGHQKEQKPISEQGEIQNHRKEDDITVQSLVNDGTNHQHH
jgi:hypothetical protein